MACCDVSERRRLDAIKSHLGSESAVAKVQGADLARFRAFPKIDAHVHCNTEELAFSEQAAAEGFKTIVSINADIALPEWPYVAEQKRLAYEQRERGGRVCQWCTTFTMEGFEEAGWAHRTILGIKEDLARGAVGVKVWKNIGMDLRDRDGKFVMVDHPVLNPIFAFLAKEGVTLIGHCGEPRNCWLPVEEMTVNNDKEYFAANPKYHMYKHPEYPSYEAQIEARDAMLAKNPTLRFMGAHLASLEYSVERLGETLRRFPTMAVDFAHRMCHLQYQAQRDWKAVRGFFEEFQDQLIYGTDLMFFKGDTPETIREKCHEVWVSDWLFLSTRDTLSCPEVTGGYQGMGLPDTILQKIYHDNALKWFPQLS